MSAEFSRAQVVWLKSGGPAMTIKEVIATDQHKEFATRGPLLHCTWFEGKKLREKSFFADLIERTDPRAAPITPPMPNETERDR